MKDIFTIWFDEEAASVFAYLVAYCLCYLALMYIIDHFGSSHSHVPMAGYSPTVLTNSPVHLETSVVKAKNE